MPTSSSRTAPAEDEFEVSIFGPGKGESVLVHLGNGDWMLVDSCLDIGTGVQPALAYLEEIGVDVAKCVHLVVGTHAHDDHIAGIADALEAAESAQFVCSSALTCDEFYALVEADADITAEFRETVRTEYRRVFSEVLRRGARIQRPWLKRAVEQRTLWERPATGALPGAKVTALSPSDKAVTRAMSALAAGTATVGKRRRLSSMDPNELAVALWIEVGDHAALLGADLLRGPSGCGWNAVLSSFDPDKRASLIKIPHHGSVGAHHDGVWERLLVDAPVSLAAPYRAGRRPLPDPEDITRICGLSQDFWITASPELPAQRRTVKRTAATLSAIATNVREPHGRPGQVCARIPQSHTDWAIEVVAPARSLC